MYGYKKTIQNWEKWSTRIVFYGEYVQGRKAHFSHFSIPSHLMRNAKVRPSKMTPWAAVKASRMAAASNFLVALGIDAMIQSFRTII